MIFFTAVLRKGRCQSQWLQRSTLTDDRPSGSAPRSIRTIVVAWRRHYDARATLDRKRKSSIASIRFIILKFMRSLRCAAEKGFSSFGRNREGIHEWPCYTITLNVGAECPLWVNKRTFARNTCMSALPPKADISQTSRMSAMANSGHCPGDPFKTMRRKCLALSAPDATSPLLRRPVAARLRRWPCQDPWPCRHNPSRSYAGRRATRTSQTPCDRLRSSASSH